MNALRFLMLLAVALLLNCIGGVIDQGGGPPEAVTVEASVDGLTITVTWTAAAGAIEYEVELFENLPGRGRLLITQGTGRKRQTQFTEASDGVRANNTYTLTVFSVNSFGRTPSTNSPTGST